MTKLLLIVCLLASGGLAAQDNFDSVKVLSHKLSDHLYFLTGAGGNIGVLSGSDGTLMVDDQFAPLSTRIQDAIKQISSEEIRFVVNTHVHGDHSGGNENFKRLGSTIIAQDNVRKRMSSDVINSRTKEVTPPRDKDAWPIVTFPQTMSVHVNDEDVELLYLGPAHTDGDVAVWFKKANAFHLGDMFVTYGYPYIDYEGGGSISGFISNLDKILLLMNDQTKVIPGHGDLCTKGDVQKFRDILADIRDQCLAAFKKGKKPGDIAGLPIASKYDALWGKGFMKGKDFVFQAAENLSLSIVKK